MREVYFNAWIYLRSKRFSTVFRTFETFVAFACPESKKFFKRSEKSTETLATQAAMVVPSQTTYLRVGRQATTAQRGKKKQLVPSGENK